MKLKTKFFQLKVFSFIFIFCSITSCDNENTFNSDGDVSSYQMEQVSDPTALISLTEFNESLTEYNNTFDYQNTRGFWSECVSAAAGSLADAAGGVAGKYIGQYAGAAIGSMTANPLNAFVGYVGGGYVGRYVGAVMASAVWNIAVKKYATSCSMSMRVPKMDHDLNIKISTIGGMDPITNQIFTSQSDSLGYYHNKIMIKIQDYIEGSAKSNFDFDDFYQYVAPIIESELNIEIKLQDNKDLYINLKKLLSSLYRYTITCLENNYDLTSYNTYVHQTIEECYPLSDKDNYILTSIIISITHQLAGQSKNKIHEYAKGLNTLINNSTMTRSEKIEIAQISSILINSALLWTSLSEF